MDKKIIKVGNSWGITLDKLMLLVSGFKPTDRLEVVCEKGQIVLTKKEK